jgi:hypothetical protein
MAGRKIPEGLLADQQTARPLSRRLWDSDQQSKSPNGKSALQPEADTLYRTVRSRFTPPERRFFKLDPLRAPSNPLNYRVFNIRTKMAVVRLRRRKCGERARKRPEMGLANAVRGSDKWPKMPAFCGIPAVDRAPKKNVPTGCLGGGRGPVNKTSPCAGETGRW